jgi:hypothetical protein
VVKEKNNQHKLYNNAATQDTAGDNTSLFSNSVYNSNQQNFNAFDNDNSFLQKQVDLQGFKPATTSATTTTTPYSYSTTASTSDSLTTLATLKHFQPNDTSNDASTLFETGGIEKLDPKTTTETTTK